MKLFRECAAGRISNTDFYARLPQYWRWGFNRFQGAGWERQGKSSNFKELTGAYLRIVDAKPSDRDDVVAAELDRLQARKNPARTAFLSEMLCQAFPQLYPVVNLPVKKFLSAIKFKGPRGASEGAAYVDVALRLRMSLRASKAHPAKSLAELDAVIWLQYQ